METNHDLRINGLGSSSGGKFNYVQINGKGDISGDIDCAELQINGLGCFEGNVIAAKMRVAGKTEISGDLSGHDIVVDGLAEVRGSISVERIENRGMIRISKDCGAEVFRSTGGFTVGGLLNSGKIDVEIYASCNAREIGGERIEIRRGTGFGLRNFIDSILPGLMWKRELTVDTIEGDDIFVEDTTAKIVRGSNVSIGQGCRIDVVEYRSSYHKESSAGITVKECRKI